MRVLLVQPATSAIGFEPITRVEPLALECLAGALSDHDVRLVDLRAGDDLEQVVASFRPRLCGLTCGFTVGTYATLRTAERIKSLDPDCFMLVGGHHASVMPEHFQHPAIDAVCIGEGEEVVREVARTLEDGNDLADVRGLVLNTGDSQRLTGERAQVDDLDRLPLPQRELVRRDSYYFHFWRPLALLETTRGCPYRCSFCSVWSFYRGTTRSKSALRALEEISAVREQNILVGDDNFFANVERAYQLAELVRRDRLGKWFSVQVRADTITANPTLVQAWYEAGLRHVFLGLEAVSDESLERLHKNSSLRDADRALEVLRGFPAIGVTGSFIVDPSFTAADFARLRTYVRRQGIGSPTYTVLTPLPGTPLFRKRSAELMTGNCDYFDLLHSVLPTSLEPAQFASEFAALYRSSYSSRTIFSKRLTKTVWRLLNGEYSVLHVLRILRGMRSMTNAGFWLLPPEAPSVPAGMPSMCAQASHDGSAGPRTPSASRRPSGIR